MGLGDINTCRLEPNHLYRLNRTHCIPFIAKTSNIEMCFLLLNVSIKSWSVTIEMKASEHYFPVLLLIMLYKVVLTFESVEEILKCGHSNKSYWAVLSCGAVYFVVQGGSNFWVCERNPKVRPFKWKLPSSTFLWWYLLCCTRWF